jgi:exopolysaccharide production protein ExoQ
MPVPVAIALTIIFVLGCYIWDSRRNHDVSPAVWLPILWLVVTGSRFPTQWIEVGGVRTAAAIVESSPLDATYFGLLMLIGAIVLLRRQVKAGELIRQNFWLIAFLVFGLISVLWSEFPFVALRRWIKVIGHPIMALVILTDLNPIDAFRTVMRRCAFFLLPTSILFVKYLPQYGRGFDAFTGEAVNLGIMLTKNDLGYVCMVFSLFFVWNILSRRQIADPRMRRDEVLVSLGFLAMAGWLLGISDSATSMATFGIGMLTMIGLGTRFVSKRHFGTFVVIVALVAIGAEVTFDVYAHVVELLGRDPTLTDRTELWTDVIAMQTNPIIGMGFESFWLGNRLALLSEKWWWVPTQAHNGYIETYLNLGLIGVFLLVVLIIATFRKITAKLPTEFEFSRLRLALLLAIVTHNYAEATFKGVHFLWTIFHIIAFQYPRKETVPEKETERVRSLVRGRGMRPAGNVARKVTAASGPTAHHRTRLR